MSSFTAITCSTTMSSRPPTSACHSASALAVTAGTAAGAGFTLRRAMLLLQDKRSAPPSALELVPNKRRRIQWKKQVRFANDLTATFVDEPTPTAATAPATKDATPSCASDETSTWYDDADYSRFVVTSRQTVSMLQQALRLTGSLESVDLEHHTMLGLEHFMSPSLEQARAQHVRQHYQRVLTWQRRHRMAAEAASSTMAWINEWQ